MRKIIFIATIIFLFLSNNAYSQDFPRHSLGGLLGPHHVGISYKARPSMNFAIVNDLYSGGLEYCIMTPYYSNGKYVSDAKFCQNCSFYAAYNLLFLYDSNKKQYDWYIGGGPKLSYYINLLPDTHHNGQNFAIGGSICVGFEWHSKRMPFDIALDIRPFAGAYIYFNEPIDTSVFLDFPVFVSLRRRF